MTDEVTLNFRAGYRLVYTLFILRKGEYVVKEYIKSIVKTGELVISGNLENKEIERAARADCRWADNIGKNFQKRQIKKGEIYQFEFGKNYVPEMSYEHRGMVIGVHKKLLYVLPIFSYDPIKYPDVFHPVDNNQSKSDFYLLKSEEYAFIQHDSVMKLNDIRTVSINRILYQQRNGRMDINSDTYKAIEELVIRKNFPGFLYDMKRMILKCEEQERTIKKLEEMLDKCPFVVL